MIPQVATILASPNEYFSHFLSDCSDSDHGYTYFVIDGICTIVQKVVIEVDRPLSTRKVLKFHPDQSIEQDIPPNVEIIFVKLRNYTNGDCFGLGRLFIFSTMRTLYICRRLK